MIAKGKEAWQSSAKRLSVNIATAIVAALLILVLSDRSLRRLRARTSSGTGSARVRPSTALSHPSALPA